MSRPIDAFDLVIQIEKIKIRRIRKTFFYYDINAEQICSSVFYKTSIFTRSIPLKYWTEKTFDIVLYARSNLYELYILCENAYLNNTILVTKKLFYIHFFFLNLFGDILRGNMYDAEQYVKKMK